MQIQTHAFTSHLLLFVPHLFLPWASLHFIVSSQYTVGVLCLSSSLTILTPALWQVLLAIQLASVHTQLSPLQPCSSSSLHIAGTSPTLAHPWVVLPPSSPPLLLHVPDCCLLFTLSCLHWVLPYGGLLSWSPLATIIHIHFLCVLNNGWPQS